MTNEQIGFGIMAAVVKMAVAARNIDDAARIIQDAIGVDTGDRAALYFMETDDTEWAAMNEGVRRELIWGYVAAEAQDRAVAEAWAGVK